MLLYYSALVVVWSVVWCATALALGGFPERLRKYCRQRWHRWSVAGVIARIAGHERFVIVMMTAWFASMYVLSYAPTTKAIGAVSGTEALTDFYVPVQWMTDETPLREPLLGWADYWGQRTRFVDESARRRAHYWGDTPPAAYAIGWGCLGIACAMGPGWFIRVAVTRLNRVASRIEFKVP